MSLVPSASVPSAVSAPPPHGCSLTGLTPRQFRHCLETLVLDASRHTIGGRITVRFAGRDGFTNFSLLTLLRFCSPRQLVECLADHRLEVFQFLAAEVDLNRKGAVLHVDHEGAEWLTLDDGGVELPADDACHVMAPENTEPFTTSTDSQGGAS